MHRLVYYSANRLNKSPKEMTLHIEQILDKSRQNNATVGVTGALIFSEGFFGQVLEGPQPAVEATFERIQNDVRHGDVSLLEFVAVEKRSFDSWSMAYVGKDSGTTLFDGIAPQTGFDSDRLKAQALLSKLETMVRNAA